MKNKARKFWGFLTALVLSFGALFAISGCTGSASITGIHMSKDEVISVPYGNFSYDGVMVTVDYADGGTNEIQLEESMISEYERLKFFKMGNQDVKVTYRNRFETTMKIDVVLNKFNDVYALVGYECVYDGLPHVVKLNHELPEGATITYPNGNVRTTAGVHEIVGVLSKKGYESKTLTTTLTILPAEKDLSGIEFKNATVVYDGESKTIEATNLPEDIKVTYDYYLINPDTQTSKWVNYAVNAGQYRVVAHFSFIEENLNYQKMDDKEATLTIEKATIDMSEFELKDVLKEYDGQPYEASITNRNHLPSYVQVSYKYLNEKDEPVNNTNAGVYKMVADFTVDSRYAQNYNPIKSLTATLTVAKRVIFIGSNVSFESKTVTFNDETVFLEFTYNGIFPSDTVEYTYENNGQKYVGEYKITVNFAAKNPNYTVDLESLDAYLVINRVRTSVKVYNDETQEYDKEFTSNNIKVVDDKVSIEGYQTDIFNLVSVKFFLPGYLDEIDPADFVDGQTYEYYVAFEYIDENMRKSTILSEESGLYKYVAE